MPPTSVRARRHNTNRPGGYAWGLVLALLWAQSLGVWHGIVHGGRSLGSVHSPLTRADATSNATSDALPNVAATAAFGAVGTTGTRAFFESLFGNHHAGVDCELFDQLCHGDVIVTALVLLLPVGVPAAPIAHLTGLAVARWTALFQARAPPFPR